MGLLSLLTLALMGSIADAGHIPDAVPTAESVPHTLSSATNGSFANSSMAQASLQTTLSEYLHTFTHTMAPGATALPKDAPPKLVAEGNATLVAHRKRIDEEMSNADAVAIEVRNDRPHRPHHLHFGREWVWCHGKGYDPWIDDDTINNCLWDKANGEGDGQWHCDNRLMYMMFQTWKNRTEAMWGCGPCFTWCFGRKHEFCDCTEQSDYHTNKVWMGWSPFPHTYTPGWQTSFTMYSSTTFIGQIVGTSLRDEKRAEPSQISNSSSIPDSSVTLGSMAASLVNITTVEQSTNVLSSSAAADIEPPTSARNSSVKSHITPAPTRWVRGGSPEFHTFTPAAEQTAEAVYRSMLRRENIIDDQDKLNKSLAGGSSLQYDERWKNFVKNNANTTNTTSMDLSGREAPPWHWISHPPQGLSCYSQGYSPQINESLYWWVVNEGKAGKVGKADLDVPYDVNISLITQFWDSPEECVNLCKDCVAWGIKDNRNLLWCDYRIGWLTSCHVGWEPIDAGWIAKTDYWGDYITTYFPTLTDHWYTTPRSMIMASEWHITPWLPAVATEASTHFYVDGTHNAVATGAPPYWDVYCTAAYAGFELSDWQTTHTRTNWDWEGWYTTVPEPSSTSFTPTHSHIYSTVYPNPVAAVATPAPTALRSGAHAMRINVQDSQSSQDDCLNSCNPCIDWGFSERRSNVTCIVKPQHADYIGLCEADFALSLDPTGTLASTSSTPVFTQVWPTGWDQPKIVNGSITFKPVTKTITHGTEVSTTTEWWAGKNMLPPV